MKQNIKKISSQFVLIFFISFFLSGCQDRLNELSANELLEIAHEHYENAKYDSVIEFLENFELRFPLHEKMPQSVYTRAISYYKNGQYAQAFAIFEAFLDRYPMHEEKINVQKYMFYCFYNQITHYERDYELIEKAFEYGNVYSQLVYKDPNFEKAYEKLSLFIAHYNLKNIYSAIEYSPKLWVKMLWSAKTMIKDYPKNVQTAEAYYRIIEFLCGQKNDILLEDADLLLTQMEEYHANTKWYQKAKMIIDKAKNKESEDIVVEIANEDEIMSDNDDVEENNEESIQEDEIEL